MLLETAEAIKANVRGGERAASRSSHRRARAMGGLPRNATRDQRGAKGKAALSLGGKAALFLPAGDFATRLVQSPRGMTAARRNAFFIVSDYGNARTKFSFFCRGRWRCTSIEWSGGDPSPFNPRGTRDWSGVRYSAHSPRHARRLPFLSNACPGHLSHHAYEINAGDYPTGTGVGAMDFAFARTGGSCRGRPEIFGRPPLAWLAR
jgi:hypothetical protein